MNTPSRKARSGFHDTSDTRRVAKLAALLVVDRAPGEVVWVAPRLPAVAGTGHEHVGVGVGGRAAAVVCEREVEPAGPRVDVGVAGGVGPRAHQVQRLRTLT